MIIPSADEVTAYALSIGFTLDGQYFCDWYETRGWIPNGSRAKMSSWKAAVRTWKHNSKRRTEGPGVRKTKLYPITGRSCGKCKMPAVYKDGSGGYDSYYCSEHLPTKIKAEYC
jgi:hypothetical protein